mgnify:CR=1 FL=1
MTGTPTTPVHARNVDASVWMRICLAAVASRRPTGEIVTEALVVWFADHEATQEGEGRS